MAKAPTIVDIAGNLGVSPISVSRALSNPGRVSASLRAKVITEARRVGYSPNTAARALRTNASFLLGLIVPSFFSYQIDELVTHIQDYAQLHDHGVILGLTQWDPETELKQLEFMRNKNVDGIIIKSQGAPKVVKKLQELIDNNIKVVCLLDRYKCQASSVMVNNIHGGAIAGRYLVENGHKKICYITYNQAKSSSYSMTHFSNERYKGMRNELKIHDTYIDEDSVIYIDAQPCRPFSEENFEVILDKIQDYTAIFAYDDYLAAGILKILQQNNYRVPEDLSIIGFDDSPAVSHWSSPPITVIKQPDRLVAFEAVNLLLGDAEDSNAICTRNNYIVEPELVIRKSVLDISKMDDKN
ncbi:Mgl repressor and galactose ultrainduction factor [Limihaloglobus sulfuriphilus]|uniref:Mgl repressor and galactose ultrainduction factor n=1 Tax=Limihaloglobus sulfuriphilus TaxID=1851148 RepID=A0A1Q2MBB9_9BACT|nr:LacI family DNA-binding transcriptional regulator [Limihaloglobus sulfuriphilus]AQQ69971.1 Mgl repressor and galactose ultrainduction factor [Limihaloglobus sulfuriphilus]